MPDTDVLVAGAGPVGLMAAVALRRHGIECRIIDKLPAPLPYAKAVGIQPRTLEIWEAMGLVREAIEAAVPLRGQLVFVNGEQVARTLLELPSDIPYGFAALPQYETERLLAEQLASRGTTVERDVELVSFEQDEERVTALVRTTSGEEVIRAKYLIGCDGAHSIVRRVLGVSFEGDAFPEQYMLGDVEVDWNMPNGFAVRAMHRNDEGKDDDILVCIPLPGYKRYRMSMLVPPELEIKDRVGGDGVAHGLEGGRRPELHHIQAVLDRLSPDRPVTASHLRWSSVFRISHRLVDRYSKGRVFVAGDAAHIHPPTGAQGMNTGIQDAWNLAWKLALAVEGAASDGLLDSYHAERFPVGEEVVGRTVRHARQGIEGDPDDPATVIRREAQLLINYRGSPIVARNDALGGDGPLPGDRAPDCGGLVRDTANFPFRLFELLKSLNHSLFLYADDEKQLAQFHGLAASASERAHGQLDVCLILAPGVNPFDARLPFVRDEQAGFRDAYAVRGGDAILVRPDGYLAYRGSPANEADACAFLGKVFLT
ncbi:MAG: FAD-dependent monooxygenase [Chloroflexota bacterium]